MAAADRALKEGQLHVKQNKFGKKWKRCYVLLYPDSPFGVARLEIYDWKDGTLAGEKFHTRKAADRKVIRLAEFIHVAPTQTEGGHKENMTAFVIETSEKTMLLSAERTVCDDWVQTLSEAAFLGSSNGGKPAKESADGTAVEMAINSIYFSREQASEFWVTVQRTEAAERCALRGSYILRAESDCLILKDPDTKESLYSWQYKLLRRYGRDKVMFSFEAGRRCASGPGNFTFETSQGHEIFQKVESSIRAQQGSENRLSGSTLDSEAPADYQSSDGDQSEILGPAPKKDAEERVLKARVLPNLPTPKVTPHLLDPSVPGKSSTPPRSPVSHHSSDSDHLTVYSEPRDSVRGAKPHFDPLYSDPVDSVSNKVKVASPLYSDLYEQVGYEVVGGVIPIKTPSNPTVPPGSEEHIYDEPEGIVRTTEPPQLYSEVRMEAAAWRKQANDEKLGYEYPYNPNTDDYSVPNYQGPRSQPRSRTGPKPVLAPKPQVIILPKPPGKDRDPEKTPCTVIQTNSNNNNGNIEALYSQVIKPGKPKSAKPQSAPPLLATSQLPSTPLHQSQTAPPLPATSQLPPTPLHQSQTAPPLPPMNKPQSGIGGAPINKPLSIPLIPPINKPQSTPAIPAVNKPQSAQPPPPPAKPHSAPISVKTLPLTVPEITKTLPLLPSPGTGQTIDSQPEIHTNGRVVLDSASTRDVSVIYEDMGFL